MRKMMSQLVALVLLLPALSLYGKARTADDPAPAPAPADAAPAAAPVASPAPAVVAAPAATPAPAASPAAPQPAASAQQTRPSNPSYERETGQRRHHRMTKNEVLFLAAIGGTSMGIGAVAAGFKGLAVGTIVGGWAAFAGHFIWNKLH